MLVSTIKTTDTVALRKEVVDVRAAVANSVPGATVKVGTGLAVMHDQAASSQSDLVRGEGIAIPILLLVFRGVRVRIDLDTVRRSAELATAPRHTA